MSNDSYIHIDEHQMIPYRIRFEFNSDSLRQIDLLRKNDQAIQFQGERLTALRYYVLLVFYAGDSSELVFITNYLQGKESITVIKSAIAASGKISQEVRAASLQNSQLFNQLIKVHHWSISQIITQLPFKSYRFTQWLSEIISLLITIIITPVIIFSIHSHFLWKLLIISGIIIFSYLAFKYFLNKKIGQTIKNRILFGNLKLSPSQRKIGLILLRIFTKPF
jgi:hypothetical protein